jgi:hypothetical protein
MGGRLHGLYGGPVAWTVEQIAEHTDGQDGAPYPFSDRGRLKKPVANNDIEALYSTFNPQTVHRPPRKSVAAIIDKGQP